MDHQGKKPTWVAEPGYGIVNVPSFSCSIRDIMAAVPEDFTWVVYVVFKGVVITELQRTKTTIRQKA